MITFLDGLITFLNTKFNADSLLSIKPSGHYAYEKGLVPTATTPYYTIEILDDSTEDEVFDKEMTHSIPIQINVYGIKMKINSVLKEAQYVSLYLAEKCKEYMENYKYSQTNVIKMRRTTITPALPYEDGSKAYYSVLRYNIILKEN